MSSTTDKHQENPVEPVEKDRRDDNAKEYYFEHLHFVNQSYWIHFRHSMGYSVKSLACSVIFFIHALWPDLFQRTGSDIVAQLNDKMQSTRQHVQEMQ